MFGASIGSFLTLVATRMDPTKTKKSLFEIFVSPSHCDHTNKKLSPLELVPVFSYLLLGGKSKNNKKKIPISYLIMEIICGVIAVVLFFMIGTSDLLLLLVYSILVFSLIYLAYFDYLYWEVQLGVIVFDFVLVVLYYIFQILSGVNTWNYLVEHLMACALGIGFIVFFIVISKGKGLGLGDAWIMGIMGLVLGFFELFLALTIASVVGSVFGLAKAYLFEGKIKGVMIQFVPFLSFGFIVTLLFGNLILDYIYY